MAVASGVAAPVAGPGSEAAPIGPVRPRRWLVPAVVATVSAEVVALWHFTASAWFFFDDFLYFRQAEKAGLSPGYLLRSFPYNGHFSPVHRLADWVLTHYFPLSWTFAQDLMLAFYAASVLALYLVLARLGRPGLGALAISAVYATSIVHADLLSWWSSGIHRLPSVLFSLVCILAWLAYRRGHRPWWLAASLGALVLALSSYEMAVLVPPYLVGLAVLVLEPGLSLGASLVAAARQWRVWAAYAAVEAAYLGVHLASSGQPARWAGLGNVIRFEALSWWTGFVPSLVGLVPSASRAAWELALPEVALAGLVAWSVVRRPRAWRTWVFFGLAFVANAAVLSLGQVAQIHPHDALQLRYYPESTYLFCLTLAAAVLAPPGATGLRRRRAEEVPGGGVSSAPGARAAPPGGRRRPVPSGPAWATTLAAAALAVHLGLSLAADQRTRTGALGPSLHADVARLASTLDQARADTGGEPSVVGGAALPASPSPWMEASNKDLLALLDSRVGFDRPSPRLFVLAPGPRLERVRPVGAPVGGGAGELTRAGLLQAAPAPAAAGRGDVVCLRAPPSGAEVGYRPRAALPGGPWYLELSYRSATAQSLSVAVTAKSGALLSTRPLAVGGRDRSLLVSLGHPASIGHLSLGLPGGARICLSSLAVGQLGPDTG